jgi:very-short-patch-repair endonuclease
MTEAEKKFWRAVRAHRFGGFTFRRQVPIAGYIVDFACHEHKLIIEIDGATHGTDAELAHDRARTAKLESAGYRVLRFWNDDITHSLPLILDQLRNELVASEVSIGAASRSPSPLEGEGQGEGSRAGKARRKMSRARDLANS